MSDQKYHQALTANRKLLAEVERLKAEVERLTKAYSDALADFWAIHKGYFDLKAEVERLRIYDVEHWNDQWLLVIEDNNRLQADVERLRKAGDQLVSALEAMDVIIDMDSNHPEVSEWNAAKESRPNE